MDQAQLRAAASRGLNVRGSHFRIWGGRAALVCVVVGALFCASAFAATSQRDLWVGAWGFPPMSTAPSPVPSAAQANRPPPNFANVTVRQLVRIAVPAEQLRLRFSNEFGETALKLGSVHVALAAADGATVPGSDHVVTFGGQTDVVIPASAPAFSDPVEWKLPALATLAISTYVPGDTVPPTHRLSVYVSGPGDAAAAVSMPGAALVRSGALVTGVDVVSPIASRVVVALGDSITEGVGSTVNTFRGWPDRLADRLAASKATRDWSVVNAGIGSNRLLHDNPGKGALARFDRDVLSVPNVAMVLLLEGINDIGYSHTVPAEAVTAQEMIGAYRQLIARAHAHGIRIIAATIPPFEDAHYWYLPGEQIRQTVNEWIRTGKAFDGVVDFDAALRDPARPTQVLATLHRGDHLHPNDAGYAAMGDAIDLKLFTQARR
jgi:lysophospholipase L1-like esterase